MPISFLGFCRGRVENNNRFSFCLLETEVNCTLHLSDSLENGGGGAAVSFISYLVTKESESERGKIDTYLPTAASFLRRVRAWKLFFITCLGG